MQLKHLDLNLEIKAQDVAEDGTFTGWASMYDVIDLGGDVVRKGAFTKTIKESKQVPILWQHDAREVIGIGTLTDTEKGLKIEAKLDMADPLAVKAYNKLKNGFLKGLSIGFMTVKDSIEGGIRHIKEAALYEVSVVTFPMLPSAQVTAVKELPLTPEDPTVKAAEAGDEAGKKSIEPEIHSALSNFSIPSW